MSRIAALALCFGLAFSGAALAQSQARVQKWSDDWAAAFNKGDAAAVAAMYASDAYVLPPGAATVTGHNAIEAFWHQTMQQIGDFKCTTIAVKTLGPRAAREIGTCAFETKAQPPQHATLKYAVVWEREGRRWKLLQDIWNSP